MDYCKLCGNIGHKFGLCTTDTVELALEPPRPCKSVELFTSVNNWSTGDQLSAAAHGGFVIHKSFPFGTHQFKFLLDGSEWVVSDLYPTVTANGALNNILQVHWKNGESVLVHANLLAENDTTKVLILLNEISLREMFERSGVKFPGLDVKVHVWGSWNDWAEAEEMTASCDKNANFTVFFLKKTLPRRTYQYKFRVNGLWLLDPFREITGEEGYTNHVLSFDTEIDMDLRELRQPSIVGESVKITPYFHEKLRLFDLVGHTLTTIGGKLWMFGGKDRDSFTNNMFRVDFNPFKVKLLDVLDSNGPHPIGFHKALKYGEKLIIYGGHDNKRVSDSYHTYSTLRNAWTSYKFERPFVREMYSVVYRRSTSRIYIFGGLYCSPDDEAEFHYDDLHVLFLNMMRFKKLKTKNPPCGRYGHSATLVNWTMYVFGGCRSDGLRKECFNDLYRIDLFDHDELEWERVITEGPRPSPRYGHLCVQFGTQMLVYGGYNDKMFNNLLGDFWVFDVIRTRWRELKLEGPPEADLRRAFHAGSMLNGSLIVFGGKMVRNNPLFDKFLKFEFGF